MDEVDRNLLEAWDRIVARCKADPAFAARREALARRDILMQPMRAWCLAIRASDTRIHDYQFIISPREGRDCHEWHEVTLECDNIRMLTAPARNPWPGMRAKLEAQKVGVCTDHRR